MKTSFWKVFLALAPALAFGQEMVPGQIIVQHRQGADKVRISESFRSARAELKKSNSSLRYSVLHVPEHTTAQAIAELERSGLFTFVEQDQVAHAADVVPNDPSFANQWHLATIQAPGAWSNTTGSANQVVAVIDSGVDGTHPDLAGKLVPGWSFLTGTTNTADVQGHGTAVAGTIAAATNNAIGVAGVSWNTMIMPLVVLNSSDYAQYSDIANAITYAADHGVRVINISIVGSTSSSVMQSAVNYAWNKGAVIFAAAGNNGNSVPQYPAACNNVVAVSATNSDDTMAGFSSFGSFVGLSAPGNYILTTTNGGGYASWYGTSFASPIAAGVASLVLSLRPGMTNASLVSLLEQNSDDLGAPGYDQYYGWGRINALRAVTAAMNVPVADTTPPVVSISSPIAGASVSGSFQILGVATDNVGVVKAEVYFDGTLAQTSTTPSSFSFTIASSSLANGTHTVEVRAYDAAGNTGSATVSFTVSNVVVSDTVAPIVAITSPQAGAVLGNQTTVTIGASDNVGVRQVTLYIDGVLASSMSTAPYTYIWNTRKVARGTHVLSSKAWDAAGNVGTSAPVSVQK